MKKITMDAYGKINLSLDVLHKRADGYHELRMIMQQIDLKDIITIEDYTDDIIIESNNGSIPLDSSNLVYKAWDALSKRCNIKRGVLIKIQKNIPVAAGLAGGSSDAAAVLKGLNILWGLDLSEEELMEVGLSIGADVPYCIMGGTALAEGIGEKLTTLKPFRGKHILLANPGVSVETGQVYKGLKLDKIKKRPDTESLLRAIEDDNLRYIADNMVNLLEIVTIEKHPIIEEIKNQMKNFGALGSLMSGSGPTVFGIFEDEENMLKCKEELLKTIDIVIATKTI